MKEVSKVMFISDLPNCPALYALLGGVGTRGYVAYIGIADSLKRRVVQHLLNRDSSVATGTAAVGINPDYVTAIRWWEHRSFKKRAALEAAELVAFDVLDPALRSRKPTSRAATALYKNVQFKREMMKLIRNHQNGFLRLPSLEEVARRLSRFEDRLEQIETQLKSR